MGEGSNAAGMALPPRLDHQAVVALVADLKAHRGADLVIDASACVHLGAKAAQTLLVARRSWAEDGRSISVEGFTEDGRDQLHLLGLKPEDFATGDLANEAAG